MIEVKRSPSGAHWNVYYGDTELETGFRSKVMAEEAAIMYRKLEGPLSK